MCCMMGTLGEEEPEVRGDIGKLSETSLLNEIVLSSILMEEAIS